MSVIVWARKISKLWGIRRPNLEIAIRLYKLYIVTKAYQINDYISQRPIFSYSYTVLLYYSYQTESTALDSVYLDALFNPVAYGPNDELKPASSSYDVWFSLRFRQFLKWFRKSYHWRWENNFLFQIFFQILIKFVQRLFNNLEAGSGFVRFLYYYLAI